MVPDDFISTKVVLSKRASKEKMIAAFFCESGCIVVLHLEDCKPFNGLWCITICLPEVIPDINNLKKKIPKHRVIFHQDNTSSYTVLLTMEVEAWKSRTDDPYSLHLEHNDNFFFPFMSLKSAINFLRALMKAQKVIDTKFWQCHFLLGIIVFKILCLIAKVYQC